MAKDDRLVEIMAEMLIKQDEIVVELKGVKSEVTSLRGEMNAVKSEVSGVKSEVSSVKSEIVKLNLQTAENTRAIFTLAEKVEQVADLHKRVSKLEKEVFK